MAGGPFDVLSEQELLEVLRRQKERDGATNRKDEAWKLSDDMLEDNQYERTRHELQKRYKDRQNLANGERIEAFCVPLTRRYADEAANVYRKEVNRELVDENGNTNDEATAALQSLLSDGGIGERLHAMERRLVVQDASTLHLQAKRGLIDAQPTPLHQVHPVMPLDARRLSPSEQSDYQGFVVELDRIDNTTRNWVFMTPAANYYYEADDWSEAKNVMVDGNEGYVWPQSEITDDGMATEGELPLQMLTWWHRNFPIGRLMPVSDCPIARINLELNVQLSCLLDTVRKQGFSQTVLNLMNPKDRPEKMPSGTGFAWVIGAEDTASSLTFQNDYGGLVGFLQFLVKYFAILERLSPNDFAIEGQTAASGFAKLVDSLPKIEAHNDAVVRFKRIEEKILWPRIGAIGIHLDAFDESVKVLRMRSTFSGLDLPREIAEVIQDEEYQLKHGFTTEAELLAKRDGISLEEAQAKIEENKSSGRTEPEPGQNERAPQQDGGLIARLIGRPRPTLSGDDEQ